MTPEALLRETQDLAAFITDIRRRLHAQPETGFDLPRTQALVRQELTALGLKPQDCGRCGLTALVEGQRPGRVFLLRADMDALPIREEADVPFAAQNGRMHACGHDLHTAMLLGAARLLKAHRAELRGTVKLMFQPAEESFQGSQDMLEAGLLEAPKVDAALMLHVMANMPFQPGAVVVSAPGVSAPAADIFEICVRGKGCHGSMPNTGVDPLTAAAHILLSLQQIQTRELGLEERAALTFGTMNAGAAPNVIPDAVTMSGSLRTFDEETRAFIKQRMAEIAQGTAAALRATATLTFLSGCPTLVNDRALSGSMETYTRELLGPERSFSVAQLAALGGSGSAGSEDFAYVSHAVPSVMLALAAGRPEQGYCYPQHHPQVRFDESALPAGAAVYAYAALRWLEDHAD